MPRPGAVPARARTQPAAQSQPAWRRPGWADAVALAGVGALALYAAAAAGAAQARATAREELIVKLGIAGAGRLDGEDGVAHSLAAIAEHMHALDRERARRNGEGRGERGGDGGDAQADIAAVFGADSADGAVVRAAEGLLRGRGWFDFYFSNLMLRAAEAPADFGVAADEMQVWVPGQEKVRAAGVARTRERARPLPRRAAQRRSRVEGGRQGRRLARQASLTPRSASSDHRTRASSRTRAGRHQTQTAPPWRPHAGIPPDVLGARGELRVRTAAGQARRRRQVGVRPRPAAGARALRDRQRGERE